MFDWAVSIDMMDKKDMTVDLIKKRFMAQVQSYKDIQNHQIKVNDTLSVSVLVGDKIVGGNDPKAKEISQTIRVFKNQDNLCLLRAVVCGKKYADKELNCKALNRYFRCERLEKGVEELVKALKIDTTKQLNAIELLPRIEMFYGGVYQIMLIDGAGVINQEPLYLNKNSNFSKYIYIQYKNNHFNTITSMKALKNSSYYCDICKVPYTNLGKHKCAATCKNCNRQLCAPNLSFNKKCPMCSIQCNDQDCYRFHTEQFCLKLKTCDICKQIKNKNHVCGNDERWCGICCKSVSKFDHKCYIQQEKIEKECKNEAKGFIFFDYECTVENGVHIPNLIKAKKIKLDLFDKTNYEVDPTAYTFEKNELFCKWLFDQKNYIAVAHNLKGYDGSFLMQYILKNMNERDSMPSVLVTGTKTLTIKFRAVKVIDSYCFLPMALEKFSKTFNITELKKGFFPHKFNVIANYNYVGPYPGSEFYGSDCFSAQKKKEFDNWYQTKKDSIFDFQQELHDYCWSDVELLAAGAMQFRQHIIETTKTSATDSGLDPFNMSITIASMCAYIYRRNFMDKDIIAIIPEKGYNAEQKTSNKCIQWLKYIALKENIYIQHALNGGEKAVGDYFVDGYCESTNTIYEMHGCLWHGCSLCYAKNYFHKMKQQTMGTVFYNHNKRINEIKNSMPTAKIVQLWEHEYDQMAKNDEEFKSFLQSYPIKERLKPRDALFGGRTEAIQLYFESQLNEIAKYYDATSLYPTVMKYGKFPLGHPVIITENFNWGLNEYFGLMKCKLLPPQNLHIPVLPSRIEKQLMFSLCRSCSSEQNIDVCNHSIEERCIAGTFVTLEVYKAIELGYRLISIDEVWHWDQTTSEIFKAYINFGIKGKQEASGYPNGCVTDEQKDAYIKAYFEKEGVLLDKTKIEFNPGLRCIFKLMLNSLWGFFAKNPNKMKHKFINQPSEWFSMVNNNQYIIADVDHSNENVLQVYYTENIESELDSNNTNVVLAAFVTAQGRLKLYSELEKLGERVLYMDTDSIIFKSKPGEYEPQLGDNLGDWTNEISPSQGGHITSFVSAGAKNYAYDTPSGETKCIVKGITLNNLASVKLNYESIKEIVVNDQTKTITVPQTKFTRDKMTWAVKTSLIDKKYGYYLKKRKVFNDLTTRPHGYKN